MPRPNQPWPIRLTHWANVPLLVIMAGSGRQSSLRIRCSARVARCITGTHSTATCRRRGCASATGSPARAGLALRLRLALRRQRPCVLDLSPHRARVASALFPPWRDTRNTLQTIAYYTRIRKTAPPQDLYNGLQRLSYTTASLLALVVVVSGVAIYKPVQLHALTVPFGGYDGRARGPPRRPGAAGALHRRSRRDGAVTSAQASRDMITGGKPHG